MNVEGLTEQIQPSNNQSIDDNMENVSENAEGEHPASEDSQSVNDSASDNTSEDIELTTTSDQIAALHDAASDGDYDTCLALIEEGVNVNTTHGDDDYTPLHDASGNGILSTPSLACSNNTIAYIAFALRSVITELTVTAILVCPIIVAHLKKFF